VRRLKRVGGKRRQKGKVGKGRGEGNKGVEEQLVR
jgi:hypothetical protein